MFRMAFLVKRGEVSSILTQHERKMNDAQIFVRPFAPPRRQCVGLRQPLPDPSHHPDVSASGHALPSPRTSSDLPR